MGSGRDSSWTWAPDLSTVCHVAHCCSRVLWVSQDNVPACKDLQDCFVLVPAGLVHRMLLELQSHGRTVPASVTKAEKPPRVAPEPPEPDSSGPFVQLWGCREGGAALFLQVFHLRGSTFSFCLGVPWLISSSLLGSGDPTGPKQGSA